MDIEGFIRMGFSEGDRQQTTVTPHTVAFIFVATDFMNEWMMHYYGALLCIAVHLKHFTITWVSPQPPPVCSIHFDDGTAATE